MTVDDLRPGYKRTEVGVIPEDWETSTVGEHFDIQLGKMLDAARNIGTLKPYINNVAVRWGTFDLAEVGSVPLTARDISRYRLVDGDLVVCEGGEIGRSAIWHDELADCYFQKTLHRLRATGRGESGFFRYLLELWSSSGVLDRFATQTSIAHLTKESLSAMPLPVPQHPEEQEHISDALESCERLIVQGQLLLAKKRDLRQAAMQELVTGRTRIPGFRSEWELKRVDMLAEIRNGGTPSTSNPRYWNGNIPWCTPTDITSLNLGKYLTETERCITESGFKMSSAEIIPAYSVVMTSRATIGECAINTVPVSTNQGFKNFVPMESVDVDFLYYLLLTLKQQFISVCGGSTFLEIGKTQVAAIAANIPVTRAEQSAIADVLSDMDAEIAALEARLAKYREIKQGMMQNLLTGAIRLV